MPTSAFQETSDTLDPRIVRSRMKVLDAATELLVEGGARAVTVDAVADRSGVAKSTMYRHFASRTDLLVEVLRHNMPDVHEIDLPETGFEPALRALLAHAAETMADRDWARILPALMSLKNTVPDIHELTEADRQRHLDHIQVVLDLGIAEGLVASDTNPMATMTLLMGPLMLAALNNEIDRLPALAEEIADRYLASCHAGCC